MKKAISYALLGGAGLALAACGSNDDRSTEATPESVEVPAEQALEAVVDEPVVDEDAFDPAANAPDPVTTERAADAAAEVAAEAAAAIEAAEAAAAAEAAEAAASLPIDE